MSDEVVEEEVKDPQGLLKMYRELQEDISNLRKEHKALTEELEATDAEAVAKWRERAVKAEAKVSLEGQGIKNAERILKYVDFDGVDLDDEKGLTGFDEKLEGIKKDFPELFDAKKRAGRSSADIHADSPAKKEMTGTEAQVARLFHK